jgi:hypothetical protein
MNGLNIVGSIYVQPALSLSLFLSLVEINVDDFADESQIIEL